MQTLANVHMNSTHLMILFVFITFMIFAIGQSKRTDSLEQKIDRIREDLDKITPPKP